MTFVEIHWHSLWIHWHLLRLHWHSLVEAGKEIEFYFVTFSYQDRQLKILSSPAHSITLSLPIDLLITHPLIYLLFIRSSIFYLFITHSVIHSNQMFALCCRARTDFAALRRKTCSLWAMWSHVVDFLKEIYTPRSKCSNEVDWNLICLIITHLPHPSASVSFICLIHRPYSSTSSTGLIHLP